MTLSTKSYSPQRRGDRRGNNSSDKNLQKISRNSMSAIQSKVPYGDWRCAERKGRHGDAEKRRVFQAHVMVLSLAYSDPVCFHQEQLSFVMAYLRMG